MWRGLSLCKWFCILRRVVISRDVLASTNGGERGRMCTLFWGNVCVLYYQIYRYINRLANGSFYQCPYHPAYFYDFSFRSFAVADRLGRRPVNTFPRAIIAQPCLTTRWRTSLTEIQNHLSRVTAGRGRHDGFRVGERRGHFSPFLFVLLIDWWEKKMPLFCMNWKKKKKKVRILLPQGYYGELFARFRRLSFPSWNSLTDSNKRPERVSLWIP